MIITPRTKGELELLIANGIEETFRLEYKSAGAFIPDKEKDKKMIAKEIAKDVSSFANSEGGIIIYGIKQFDDSDKRHLPEKITPIDRKQYSQEWLEQIIHGNISPKIEGLHIHPIPLDQYNEVVYAVEIPQSTTAHQNTVDGRYYRRYDFRADWMRDYEVRDVMNRSKHPVIKMEFIIEKHSYKEKREPLFHTIPPSVKVTSQSPQEQNQLKTTSYLKMYPVNKGSVFAQYINYFIDIPDDLSLLPGSSIPNFSKNRIRKNY